MSAKVLHIINSPYFGLCNRVTDITQAVRLLGLDIIKSLVFMTQIFSVLQHNNPLSDCLDVIWRHSLNVSVISKQIAQMFQLPRYEEDAIFKSGLFHDIGKIILSTRLPEVFLECLRMADKEDISCWEAEMAIIGVSHAEIGAYLLGLWGFSDQIVETVFFHHRPDESGCRDFNGISIIHAANAFEHQEFEQNSLISTNQKLNIEFLQNLQSYEHLMAFFNAYRQKSLNVKSM
jgi:putative nucleotidyltransferase with HDIG domain